MGSQKSKQKLNNIQKFQQLLDDFNELNKDHFLNDDDRAALKKVLSQILHKLGDPEEKTVQENKSIEQEKHEKEIANVEENLRKLHNNIKKAKINKDKQELLDLAETTVSLTENLIKIVGDAHDIQLKLDNEFVTKSEETLSPSENEYNSMEETVQELINDALKSIIPKMESKLEELDFTYFELEKKCQTTSNCSKKILKMKVSINRTANDLKHLINDIIKSDKSEKCIENLDKYFCSDDISKHLKGIDDKMQILQESMEKIQKQINSFSTNKIPNNDNVEDMLQNLEVFGDKIKDLKSKIQNSEYVVQNYESLKKSGEDYLAILENIKQISEVKQETNKSESISEENLIKFKKICKDLDGVKSRLNAPDPSCDELDKLNNRLELIISELDKVKTEPLTDEQRQLYKEIHSYFDRIDELKNKDNSKESIIM